MLTELARMQTKDELDATAQYLADERMAHKDARDRMQLELAEARALSDELQRSPQQSLAEKGPPGENGGVRAPMVPPDTPRVPAVIRGANWRGINRRCWSCQLRPLPPEDRTSCEGLSMYMNSVQSGKVSCYFPPYGSKGRADYKWEREPGANSPGTNYHRGQASFPPGSQVHQSRGGGCCGTEKNPVEIQCIPALACRCWSSRSRVQGLWRRDQGRGARLGGVFQ